MGKMLASRISDFNAMFHQFNPYVFSHIMITYNDYYSNCAGIYLIFPRLAMHICQWFHKTKTLANDSLQVRKIQGSMSGCLGNVTKIRLLQKVADSFPYF